MSNVSKKMLMAAAGAAGGAGLDVDEVFSTFVYDGNNTGQSIVNGIDLSGEGGLVWTKARDYGVGHALVDTVRGNTKYLEANGTDAEATTSVGITAFNSTGYNLGADDTWKFNVSNSYVSEYVSWSFRKAPKFFDCVSWSDGDGTTNHSKQISHNLGSTPGMIIVKKTTNSDRWQVAHRSMSTGDVLYLNTNDAKNELDANTVRIVNDSYFTVAYNQTNEQSNSYVAYLFAHNNNDGGFGPDADQDAIKCGSISHTNGSDTTVDLGFEPQWLMVKCSSTSGNFFIVDNMRGITTGGNDARLYADSNGAESEANSFDLTSSGFILKSGFDTHTYIYMAIRRGPLAAPTDATKVFAIDTATGTSPSPPHYNSGFPVDMGFYKDKSSTDSTDWYLGSRLTQGKVLKPNSNASEANDSALLFDFQNGFNNANWTNTNYVGWMWKRAPSYFDVVATVTSSAQINHNLGVTPELAFYFNRSGDNIQVFAPTDGGLFLNSDARSFGYGNGSYIDKSFGANATATTVSSGGGALGNNQNVLIYLFASLSGVSKIGGVVHSGTTNVDAGFSSGSRFVLVKRVDGVGDWLTWDGTRGIVSGNDPYLALNSTAAEVTNTDYIDPYSAGFTLTSNLTSGTYLYYAIA